MFDYQFYPTPPSLAHKAWSLFQNKEIRLFLEPSAGNGDLLVGKPSDLRADRIHLAEIDVSRHPLLRERGQVVGVDFLEMSSLSLYSHVLLNPPFAKGATHVLHAWDGLWSGEIVAIINAETLRNPCTQERQRLLSIIDCHGSYRYEQEAFLDPETQRKTAVEIALVWLQKKPEQTAFDASFLDSLQQDVGQDTPDIQYGGQVALRGETLKNLVIAFQAAWKAELATVQPRAQADYYRTILGQKLAEVVQGTENAENKSIRLQSEIAPATGPSLASVYQDLKERAWTAVLMATETEKYLTRKAIDKIRAEFTHISKLEFTLSNIYAFLQGLAESQGDIHLDICLDLFDRITRTGVENVAFYKPWKSNEKHRVGMKIRAKRFILGGFSLEGWRHALSWDAAQGIKDLDRAFAVLDGKPEPEVSLYSLFNENKESWYSLRAGNRLSCSYFEVRYYPGVGTIHFYPARPELIDRLNQLVGRHRQWIPQQEHEDFSAQYRDAEKITARMLLTDKKTAERALYGYRDGEAGLASSLERALDLLGYETNWQSLSSETTGDCLALPSPTPVQDAIIDPAVLSSVLSSIGPGSSKKTQAA